LTSVLSNLLDNSIKYIVQSPPNRRDISVHVRDAGLAARVEVEDSGPGLPLGCEEQAFEPFRRFTQATQPGIGLGLATVKKIVDAYKGRVGVRSRPGQGSTFWFELAKPEAATR
jgi:signal transduction histidine kinase